MYFIAKHDGCFAIIQFLQLAMLCSHNLKHWLMFVLNTFSDGITIGMYDAMHEQLKLPSRVNFFEEIHFLFFVKTTIHSLQCR